MEINRFDNMRFEREPDGIGDIFSIDEWYENVDCRCIIDDDGTGYWMKDGKVHSSAPGQPPIFGDDVCEPELIDEARKHGITGVIWYNK